MELRGKNIVLIVTGGIAAYKSLDLARLFVLAGANVYPIMTYSAEKFITRLSMEALCKNTVSTELFALSDELNIDHIGLAKKADLVVVAPATANIIGKCANGLGDDLATTVILATKAPVLIAPAMNTNMYDNAIVQDNISKLKKFNFNFVGPVSGELACGDVGLGKLSDVEDIFKKTISVITFKDLKGKKILVTAGGTREFIDPVRYITNSSSGKMGLDVAMDAHNRGADVTLITTVKDHCENVFKSVLVESAGEMYDAVFSSLDIGKVDALVMTAAVSDFTPKNTSETKIKTNKSKASTLELVPTSDILKSVGESVYRKSLVLVGFALETNNGAENALKKLKDKNLDFIVLNSSEAIGSDFNKAVIFSKDGSKADLPKLTKPELSKVINDSLLESIKKSPLKN